ncbi:MAG: hypothetical protein LBU38_07555, partial [Propionibacteriaceae bacterium]|nr:hypothetical protein [Propionibacteriaceae bacterium]
MIRIFPTSTWYRPTSEVVVALEADAADLPLLRDASLLVSALERTVGVLPAASAGEIVLGKYRLGAYGIDLLDDSGKVLASTAFDVLNSALDRPRYGFLTSFGSGVPLSQVQRHFLRLHLNMAQYYDWAWR